MSYVKVRAHDGDVGNEKADRLAGKACWFRSDSESESQYDTDSDSQNNSDSSSDY